MPNIGRLKSALARARNIADYAKPDATGLAAAYLYGLVRNHPFADGNKRTAWVIARLFLADNGLRLQFEPADAVGIVKGVAAGTIAEAELAAWFRKRILSRETLIKPERARLQPCRMRLYLTPGFSPRDQHAGTKAQLLLTVFRHDWSRALIQSCLIES